MNYVTVLLVIIAAELTWSLPVYHRGVASRVKRDINNGDYKVLCYYVNWSQYRSGNGRYTVDNIDSSLCTHILYAFAKVQGNDLTVYEYNDVTMYQQLQDLKKRNPSLKTLLSVGGATSGDAFKTVASSTKNREEFAENVLRYARKYGFDGVDIDWEYPWAQDKSSFTEMIKEIYFKAKAEAFATRSERLLVTCALGAAQSIITQSYDLVNLQKYIDFATVMTYDLHGGWDHVTGFQAAVIGSSPGDVFNQKWVVEKYLSLQFPSNKLILGIPTYGRTYTLCNTASHGVRSCSKGFGRPGPYTKSAGILAYNEICEKLNADWTESFDAGQRNPYAYKGDQWVGYDDIRSVKAKIEFATQQSLGGVMFWDLSMDDFRGKCNEGKYPLISQAKILIDRTTTNPQTSGPSSIGTTLPSGTSTTAPPSVTATTTKASTTTTTPLPSATTTTPLPSTTTRSSPSSTTTNFEPPASTSKSASPAHTSSATPLSGSSRTAPIPTSRITPPPPPATSTMPPGTTSRTAPPSTLSTTILQSNLSRTATPPTLSSTVPPSPTTTTAKPTPTATGPVIPGNATGMVSYTTKIPTTPRTTTRMSTTQQLNTRRAPPTAAPNPTLSTTTMRIRFSTGFSAGVTNSPVSVTCPSLFAFLEHPTDCRLFYRCVWGKPMTFQCPRGTYFNLKLPGCDWPSAVFRNCPPAS